MSTAERWLGDGASSKGTLLRSCKTTLQAPRRGSVYTNGGHPQVYYEVKKIPVRTVCMEYYLLG